jgi:hypothetical protein
MNFNWLLNGTIQAHHLAAVYIAVWVVQGSYAGWIAWQWARTRRDSRPFEPLTSVTRKES